MSAPLSPGTLHSMVVLVRVSVEGFWVGMGMGEGGPTTMIQHNLHSYGMILLSSISLVAFPTTFPKMSSHLTTIPFSSGEAVTVRVEV